MDAKRLTNLELRALMGCSRAQVTAWEKAGMPYTATGGKRGKPRHSYGKGAVLEWIRVNGSVAFSFKAGEVLDKMKGREDAKEGRTREGGEAEAVGSAGDADAGENGPGKNGGTLLDKVTETLLESHARFVEWNAKEKELLAAGHIREAAGCARARAEAGKAVAQLQMQVTAAAKEMGVLVVASEMESWFLKHVTTWKNQVTMIPESAIPVIIPFLRESEDAAKVREVLRRLVDGTLQSIANMKTEE